MNLGIDDVLKRALPIQEKLKKESPYKEIFEDWKEFVTNQEGKNRNLEHLVGIAAIRFKPFYQEFIKRLKPVIGEHNLLKGEAGYQVLKGDSKIRQAVVDRLYP